MYIYNFFYKFIWCLCISKYMIHDTEKYKEKNYQNKITRKETLNVEDNEENFNEDIILQDDEHYNNDLDGVDYVR